MSNVHDLVGSATPTKGGNNISDGDYEFAVEKLILKEDGQDGPTFIAELRVMESRSVPVSGGQLNPEEHQPSPNPIGTNASLVCKVAKHQNAKGNWKGFLIGLLGGLGYSESQIDGAVSRQVVSDSQPARGARVRCATYRKQNQGRVNAANKGQWMILQNWSTVPGQTAESIKATRSLLDAGAPAVAVPPPIAAAPAPVAVAPAPPILSGILGGLGK